MLSQKDKLQILKKIHGKLWPATFLFFGITLFVYLYAPSLGEKVGNIKGTYRGWTDGSNAGAEAGKEEGLSANDTKIRIGSELKETGNLQVLLIDLKLADIYTQGKNGKNYAALMMLEGEAVFTVDLMYTKVEYDENQDEIEIAIPRPEVEVYYDDSTLEKLAEYYPETLTAMFGRFFEDAQDGYMGYLNSRAQWEQKAKEELESDVTLKEQAEKCATEQVERLAKSVCGDKKVTIRFIEAEE